MFSEVDAYITGSFDPGLFIISAKPHQNFSFKKCEQAIDDLFDKIINGKFESSELEKVKNRIVAMRQIELSAILNKAINLAYYEWLGDANLINSEDEKYLKVDDELIKKVAKLTFDKNNCSTLYYMSK
jgi:predicted Zn-dependent peptidase